MLHSSALSGTEVVHTKRITFAAEEGCRHLRFQTAKYKRNDTKKSLLDLPDITLDRIWKYIFAPRISANGLSAASGTTACNPHSTTPFLSLRGDLSIVDASNYVRRHAIPILFRNVSVQVEGYCLKHKAFFEHLQFGVIRHLCIDGDIFSDPSFEFKWLEGPSSPITSVKVLINATLPFLPSSFLVDFGSAESTRAVVDRFRNALESYGGKLAHFYASDHDAAKRKFAAEIIPYDWNSRVFRAVIAEGVLYSCDTCNRSYQMDTSMCICSAYGIHKFTIEKGRIWTSDFLSDHTVLGQSCPEDGTPAEGIASYQEMYDAL